MCSGHEGETQPCQNNAAQMQQRGNAQIQTAGSEKKAGIKGAVGFPKSKDVRLRFVQKGREGKRMPVGVLKTFKNICFSFKIALIKIKLWSK